MAQIPTAEEYIKQYPYVDAFLSSAQGHQVLKDFMVGFAKLHLEACKQDIAENIKLSRASSYGTYNELTANFEPTDESVYVETSYGHGDYGYTAVKPDVNSILNSYPSTNIK